MKKKVFLIGISSSLLMMPVLNMNVAIAQAEEQLSEEVNVITSNLTEGNKISLDIQKLLETLGQYDADFLKKINIDESNDFLFSLVIPIDDNYQVTFDKETEQELLINHNLGNIIYNFSKVPSEMEFILKNIENSTSYNVVSVITINEEGIVESFEIDSFEKVEESLPENSEEGTEQEEVISPEGGEPEQNHDEPSNEEVPDPIEKPEEVVEEVQEPVKEESKEENNEESKEGVVEESTVELPQKARTFSTLSAPLTAQNGFYTVKPKDTFNSIARGFNLSTLQLQVYNPQIKNINIVPVNSKIAVTRQAYESTLSAEEKAHLYTGNGSSNFDGPTNFFNYLFPYARELANAAGEERLYVSIMLAQAALESGYGNSALASPPYYNLTGIKRKGNENYVKMWTREETKDKESYYVLADFKVFPSYYEALKGNADLIRYRGYYNEVWVKNSPTYKDAVVALDESPYATDNNYGSKILNIINTYKLYKYDFDKILSSKNTSYFAKVLFNNTGIYTLPKFADGSVLVTSYRFNGENIKVIQEATTESGTYAKLARTDNGSEIGWIKKTDLSVYDSIQKQISVDYYGTIRSNNGGIYSSPKGTFNSVLYTNYLYNGKNVKIVEEATTNNGTFSKLVNKDNGAFIGWINKSDLTVHDSILNKKNVEYYGYVMPNNEGIYSSPKGTLGAVLYTSYLYNWDNLKAVEEATTNNGTFVRLVTGDNKNNIGWINKADFSVYNSTSKNYHAKVKVNNSGIFNSPSAISKSLLFTKYLYNGKDVRITEEVNINGNVYARLVRPSDNVFLGWINVKDLTSYTTIQSSLKTAYTAKVKAGNGGVYSLPKGSYGALLYTNYLYNNKAVRVIEEVTTQNGIYAKLITTDNGVVIGWIEKASLVH